MKTVDIIESAVSLKFSDAAVQAMKADTEKAKAGLAAGIKANLGTTADVVVTKIEFESRRLGSSLVASRRLQNGVNVEFYVKSSAADVTSKLTALSEGTGVADLGTSIVGELKKSVADFPADEVVTVTVEAPEKGTVMEEVVAPPVEDDGGMGGGVIVIIVLVILGVGGAGFYFYSKKSS